MWLRHWQGRIVLKRSSGSSVDLCNLIPDWSKHSGIATRENILLAWDRLNASRTVQSCCWNLHSFYIPITFQYQINVFISKYVKDLNNGTESWTASFFIILNYYNFLIILKCSLGTFHWFHLILKNPVLCSWGWNTISNSISHSQTVVLNSKLRMTFSTSILIFQVYYWLNKHFKSLT